MKNPTEEIKKIEKEIEEYRKGDKPVNITKLQIYKEWEQREKEILEDEIKFLEELKNKIKGEEK